MPDNKKDVRKDVSKFYAEAVKKGCGCGCGDQPKGAAVISAGYSKDELAGLPADAVTNSFGCGNPLALANVKPGDVVLDLGSGAGIDLLIAAKIVGPAGKAIGVDMTDEMIERARANAKAAGFENIIDVRKGYIEQLPVDDNSVDCVISNCVINLSPDKDRVFHEIFRVLKKGGRVNVSDIVANDLPDWILENATLYSSCVAGAISEDDYIEGMRMAGLTGVEVTSRTVYDEESLKSIIYGEIPKNESSCCGGVIGVSADIVNGLAKELTGKIWSAKITATKQ